MPLDDYEFRPITFQGVAFPATLERLKKYCSRSGNQKERAVFLDFGFVSAQSQAAAGMLLRRSLAKNPKILAPNGYSIFLTALMGISILEPVLGITDEDLGDWLWRLTICCGFPKRAAADRCARCARQAANLMLEQRQRVLDGIHHRLGPYGFDPETTYRDWLLALQRIAELGAAADGECIWSAPAHPRDPLKSEDDVRRLIDSIARHGPGSD